MDTSLILVSLFIVFAIVIVIFLSINAAIGIGNMNRPQSEYKYYLIRVDAKGDVKIKRYNGRQRGGIYKNQF